MRYTHSFNGKTIFFLCNDSMKDIAELFSTILQQEDMTHDVINDKKTIQIGWGFYKIQQVGNEYQVMAYDLMNDPFQTVTENLSLSLEIFLNSGKF